MPMIVRKLAVFTREQALSCLFPGVIFASLAVTKLFEVPGLPRYDLLLLICIGMQVLMVAAKLETRDELRVITCFHIIGTALELFKVQAGSWSYPEEGWTKLFGVPLYAGFMYASVASYICQAWRRMRLAIDGWPPSWLAAGIAGALYLNFYTHHYMMDLRWVLLAVMLLAFRRTWVRYTVDGTPLRMPMTVAFGLIAFFVWIGENIGTLLGAWQYPNQVHAWQLVHWGKLSSWFVLVSLSVILVGQLKRVKSKLGGSEASAPAAVKATKSL